MMKKEKRLLTLLLAVLMLVSLVPMQASADSNTKLIALTFDDGPSSSYTPTLLDGLKARGAHVTFFVQGQSAQNNPSIIKRAWEEGHQICSHTYNHALLTSLSDSEIKSQLSRTNSILDKAIGYDLKYQLRPPYGGYNSRVLNAANTPCYYWSVDTRDWESLNTAAAYNQFIRAARNGSIVLMHDIHGTTIPAALQAIDTLQAQGYKFVTLNELLVRRGITPTAGEIYFDAYPGDYGTGPELSLPKISYKDTESGKKVVITGDSRAKIYYTTDGSTPMPDNSKRYTKSFSVSDNTVVTARCVYDWNGFKTDCVSKKIEWTTLSAPTISVKNGKISFSGIPKAGHYYYTTDGTTPTSKSTRYEGSFTAKANTVYTVRGYCTGYRYSTPSWITYGASGKTYTDVKPDAWYFAAADRAIGEGIMPICSGKTLAPDRAVSRAQLVNMLYNMAGKPDTDGLKNVFSDVSNSSKYIKPILWAYGMGITNGYGEGLFNPYDKVTREQTCAMLARYAEANGADLSAFSADIPDTFTDKDDIEPCLLDSVSTMYAMGIIKGYGDDTLRPKGGISRAETATMLMRLADALK